MLCFISHFLNSCLLESGNNSHAKMHIFVTSRYMCILYNIPNGLGGGAVLSMLYASCHFRHICLLEGGYGSPLQSMG